MFAKAAVADADASVSLVLGSNMELKASRNLYLSYL